MAAIDVATILRDQIDDHMPFKSGNISHAITAN